MVEVIELVEGCRKLAAVDPVLEPDRDLCSMLVGIAEARAALDAAELAVLVEVDARNVTDVEFGLTTARWLARNAKASVGGCKGRVKAARKLRERLPLTAAALAEHRISFDHVRVLVRCCKNRIADAFVELEGELLELARGMVFEDWRREVEGLAELLDQDGAFDPNDDLDRNGLSISATLDGIVKIDGTLTGDNAVVFAELVNTKADQLYRRFRDQHKEHPELEMPSRRTLLALALVELVRAGAAVELASTRPPGTEAHLIVPAGLPLDDDEPDDDTDDRTASGCAPGPPHPRERAQTLRGAHPQAGPSCPDHPQTLRGAHPQASRAGPQASPASPPHRKPHPPGPEPPDWLDPYDLPSNSKLARLLATRPRVTTRHGVPVQDGTVRLLGCDARWQGFVVDHLGIPLDMGRTVRLATDAQRKAIAIRDGGCVFDGCPNPITWCDIHHVDWWEHGGHTDLDTMAALCRHCHGLSHRKNWTMRATGDGWFEWDTPNGDTIPSQRHHRRRTTA